MMRREYEVREKTTSIDTITIHPSTPSWPNIVVSERLSGECQLAIDG